MCIRFSHTVCKLIYASVCVSVCSLNCTEEVTNCAGMRSLVRCFLISCWNVQESSLISPCYFFLPAEVSLSLVQTHIEISSLYTLFVLSLCFLPVGAVCSHLGKSFMLVNMHHCWVMPRWGHPYVFLSLPLQKKKNKNKRVSFHLLQGLSSLSHFEISQKCSTWWFSLLCKFPIDSCCYFMSC